MKKSLSLTDVALEYLGTKQMRKFETRQYKPTYKEERKKLYRVPRADAGSSILYRIFEATDATDALNVYRNRFPYGAKFITMEQLETRIAGSWHSVLNPPEAMSE